MEDRNDLRLSLEVMAKGLEKKICPQLRWKKQFVEESMTVCVSMEVILCRTQLVVEIIQIACRLTCVQSPSLTGRFL